MKIWEKEIVFNKYTRWIDRDYQKILTEWLKIQMPKLNEKWEVIPETEYDWKYMENMQRANDFLVNKMTWLTQDEIDNLSIKDFDLLINEINKLKETPTTA